MGKRSFAFVLWALLGGVVSYGLLYLFTPYGLGILAAAVLAALLIPVVGGSRWPEAIGLLAGPGILFWVVARNKSAGSAWFVAGCVFVIVALVLFWVISHRRGSATD